MMAVSIQTQRTTFRAAAPELSFIGPFETGSSHFDISPDGTYFVMVEADPDARPTPASIITTASRCPQSCRLAPVAS
jgi:hypothetical protein